MGAFRFSLQNVLEYRKRSENESARGLAIARDGADRARTAREDLEAAREAGRSRLAQAHGAGGAVGHLQNMAYVLDSVEQRIKHASAACEQADKEVVESLESFHRALQDRRTMDHLRERKLLQWRTEELRHEQQTMDEVALVRHRRPSLDTSRDQE